MNEYKITINRLLERAKAEGSGLVLLPQYTGCLWSQLRKRLMCFSELLSVLEDHNDDFLDFCCNLACHYNIYIGTGTLFEKTGAGIYHTGYIVSNEGTVILKQRQTHLSRTEREWGLVRGNELEVIDTGFGRAGMVIGTDRYYPEVSRILALQGVEVVLAPGAEFGHYNPHRQLAGMWREVQQNQFFALESYFNGPVLDRHITGSACILAPCELTEGSTGFLTDPEDGLAEDDLLLKTSSIKPAELKIPREKFPVFKQFNVALYNKIFPQLYCEYFKPDTKKVNR